MLELIYKINLLSITTHEARRTRMRDDTAGSQTQPPIPNHLNAIVQIGKGNREYQ